METIRHSESLEDGTASVKDMQSDNHYVQVARENWLAESLPGKVRQDVLKRDIWDVLESEHFRFGSLLVLENLQMFEQ